MRDEDDFEVDDELQELAESLQVGDKAEGAAALAKVIRRAQAAASREVASAAPKQDADADDGRQRVQEEIDETVRRFGEEHRDIVTDPARAEQHKAAVRGELEDDLRGLGFSDEDLHEIRGDTRAMVGAYVVARARGASLRTSDEIFAAAGERMSGHRRTFVTGTGRPVARRTHVTGNGVEHELDGEPDTIITGEDHPEIEGRRLMPRPAPVARAHVSAGRPPKRSHREVVESMRLARGYPTAG
jgi:hypothetical protein